MTQVPMSDEQVTEAVRDRYAAAARARLAAHIPGCGCGSSCCGTGESRAEHEPASGGCCAPGCCADDSAADPITRNLYDADDTPSAGALSASLGCGNPTALADLRPGLDVLDLGSGGGLDVLLSARRVAPGGTAYGVDMTEEMLALAERNRTEAGIENARFVKGAIEELPLPDGSVDVVISNCVINLSRDKDAVLREAHRVLRPGGRLAVSDIVLLREIAPQWAGLVGLWTGCVAGALRDEVYLDKLVAAGFERPSVEVTRRYTRADLEDLAEQLDAADLPAGLTKAAAVAALDGAFASAFIRAQRSEAS
ncbi:MAG: arsenite methyltransferase [Tetrasphaera sp.]